MKLGTFCISGAESEVKALLILMNDPQVSIVSKHLSPGTDGEADIMYVFYETLTEQTIAEAVRLDDDRENLKRLCKTAAELQSDIVLPGLKNQKQREMYLASKGIGRQDAADIIELLKPEMQSVVEWGRTA
jgi:hypothetical protein